MWGARLAVTAFIGWMSLGAVPGSAQEWNPFRPDVRIWKGRVDVVLEGSQKDSDEKTSEQSRYTYRLDKTVSDVLHIEACGAAGQLAVTAVTRDFSEKRDLDKEATNARAQCTPHDPFGRVPVQYVSPGSWSERVVREKIFIYTGEGSFPLEKGATVMLTLFPRMGYRLSATHNMMVSYEYDEVDKTHDACANKTKILESHSRTIPPDQPGRIERSEDGLKTWIFTQPKPRPQLVNGEGKISKNRIAKPTFLYSQVEPGKETKYEEKTTASWHFEATSPCPEVYRNLLFELAAAEAYADRELRDFASDSSDYDKKVNGKIRQIFTGKPAGSGQGGSSAENFPLAVDKNCEIVRRADEGEGSKLLRGDEAIRAYEEQHARACEPAIVAEATVRHEQEHVSQCQGDRQRFSPTGNKAKIQSMGQSELSAYLVSARFLLSFLEDFCQDEGLDLAGPRERLGQLEAFGSG